VPTPATSTTVPKVSNGVGNFGTPSSVAAVAHNDRSSRVGVRHKAAGVPPAVPVAVVLIILGALAGVTV
jgi:hypothetical protein